MPVKALFAGSGDELHAIMPSDIASVYAEGGSENDYTFVFGVKFE